MKKRDPVRDQLKKLEKKQRRVMLSPGCWYDPELDTIFFYFEPASHYDERVHEFLTVYRARDDNRIIGGYIAQIRRLLLQHRPKLRKKTIGLPWWNAVLTASERTSLKFLGGEPNLDEEEREGGGKR